MNFPSYVPAGARAHITRTLEGDGQNWRGVNAFVTEYQNKGVEGDALEGLKREQACMLRFAHDPRMRDVYARLQTVFTNDEQYADFLRSAWEADMNFSPFRKRVKQAKELAPKIAEAARELASLLKQAGEVGGGVAPGKFFSVRVLLDATDNHEHDGRDFDIWQIVRKTVTARRPERPDTASPATNTAAEGENKPVIIVSEEDAEEAERNNPDAQIIVLRGTAKGDIDPEEQAREWLGYAWGKAPPLSAILGTVAQAADDWRPQESGAIGAAISSRKQNPVTEYLRAFADLLRDKLQIALDSHIIAAIAFTANVVLTDPNIDISADGARKAVTLRPVEDSR